MRLAYKANIVEKDLLSRVIKRSKKGIVKGSHNSRSALIDQAHIQSVAIFLAEEFNAKLEKLKATSKK
jgi:hypothetical protein